MSVKLNWRLQDDESDTQQDVFTLEFPLAPPLATLQAYADGFTPLLDAVTESQIMTIDALYSLTVEPTAKAAPIAGAFNERGGLIGFEMSIPNVKDSLRIPAIMHSIMTGDSFSLSDPDVAALVAYVVNPQEGIEAINRWVASYVSALYARKSVRRK